MEPGELFLSLKIEINKRVQFITDYLPLSESHMVDFFVKDHWKKLVNPDAQAQLLKCDESDLFSVKRMLEKYSFSGSKTRSGSFVISELDKYFSSALECEIACSQCCFDAKEIEKKFETDDDREEAESDSSIHLLNTSEYMCCKKSHEVEEMSRFVNTMSRRLKLSHILDMGSGKGYLGTYLSLRYGLDVIGVDCCESNSISAQSRSQKFMKYWNKLLKNRAELHFENTDLRYSSVTAHIDSGTDLNELLPACCVETKELKMENKLLTGLHACGDLTPTALRVFVTKPEVKGICVVGCCYHQLTSDGTADDGFPMSNYLRCKKFTLGRNTRMLGLKALDRIQGTDAKITEEKSSRSLFYRAVLSVILFEEFGLDSSSKELRVGKEYSKSKDFVDYVRRSLRKLKVPEEKAHSLSDQQIETYMQSMEPSLKSLLAFSMLREAFGPAVEALILLDRLLYLKEQELENHEMNSYLVRLFDRVKSPRCYALVAMKNC